MALLLAVVLAGQMLPLQAWAQEVEPTGGPEEPAKGVLWEEEETSDPAAGEAGAVVLGEVTSLRGESEKHFRMDDGSFLAVNYGVPVHYAAEEDGEAVWEDIDNTLRLQLPETGAAALGRGSVQGSRYTAVNGGDARTFAGDLSGGFLFSAASNRLGVQVSLPEAAAEIDEAVRQRLEPAAAQEPAEETVPVTVPEAVPVTEAETEPETIPYTEPEETGSTTPEETAAPGPENGPLPDDVGEESLPGSTADTGAETVPETIPGTEPEAAATEPETVGVSTPIPQIRTRPFWAPPTQCTPAWAARTKVTTGPCGRPR